MAATISYKGSLFTKDIESLVEEALEETLDYGIGLIQDRTPVRTGALREGFSVEQRKLKGYISNSVFYFPYIEDGTSKITARRMVARSINEINNYLDRAVENKLDGLR